MRNIINIQGYDQKFGYMLEYIDSDKEFAVDNMSYHATDDTIYLHNDEDNLFFRYGNNWSKIHTGCTDEYIPATSNTARVRLYFPNHSLDNYEMGVKYMLTINTWIGGHKIDLGSYQFGRTDALAIETGVFTHGLDRYYDYVEVGIIDPYELVYSDNWKPFRENVCAVNMNNNNIGSILTATLYVVDYNEDDSLMISDDILGGTTSFNIATRNKGFIKLNLAPDIDNLGWKFTTILPNIYCQDTQAFNRLFGYFRNAYGMPLTSSDDVTYELVLKNPNANTIILGPTMHFEPDPLINRDDHLTQTMGWRKVLNESDTTEEIRDGETVTVVNPRCGFRHFFSSWVSQNDGWPHFEPGWVVQGSMMITSGTDSLEILSNEIPVTQEVFKYFVGMDKDTLNNRHKIEDMEIKNYTLVNTVRNEVVQIDRPENSKSNIIQPVFFKVKETELLTIHPEVTENICINLDDYKSKVDVFYLQIEKCRFEQVGANKYGIIFKVVGRSLPNENPEGTYYILNEDYELVTTGRYKYTR